MRPVDIDSYFLTEPDRRKILSGRIFFENKKKWSEILSNSEIAAMEKLTATYRSNLKKYRDTDLKKELERITVEFSWKSSMMEGNTYTLLDTERLIREHEVAPGKKREETRMILNHKKALEYGLKHARSFKKISRRMIEDFHELTVSGLGTRRGLRTHPVGIIGTSYRPHDNVYQIREALEYLCKLVNYIDEPVLKAMISVAGLSYIQPFGDGNKRTSRLIGNAILLAYGYCPLSYRSVDEIEYKKSLILFYEQHTLISFKKVFLDQYRFAVKNYFV